MLEGDYQSAIRHLKYAIGRNEEESRFYMLMGVSHALSGDNAEAQRWIERAKELASQENDRHRYDRKIELLKDLESSR